MGAPKRTLGFASRTEAVLALRAEGHSTRQIADRIGIEGKRRGWTRCPRCGGKIAAFLAGSRDHLHMSCETQNCIRMME